MKYKVNAAIVAAVANDYEFDDAEKGKVRGTSRKLWFSEDMESQPFEVTVPEMLAAAWHTAAGMPWGTRFDLRCDIGAFDRRNGAQMVIKLLELEPSPRVKSA